MIEWSIYQIGESIQRVSWDHGAQCTRFPPHIAVLIGNSRYMHGLDFTAHGTRFRAQVEDWVKRGKTQFSFVLDLLSSQTLCDRHC